MYTEEKNRYAQKFAHECAHGGLIYETKKWQKIIQMRDG